jgi:hypothetical protein
LILVYFFILFIVFIGSQDYEALIAFRNVESFLLKKPINVDKSLSPSFTPSPETTEEKLPIIKN